MSPSSSRSTKCGEEVITAWEKAEAQTRLEARANDLAEELRNGREMAALGLNLQTQRDFGRDGFIEGTPPDFAETVFGLEPDGLAVLAADGDAWLIRLDAVIAADSASPEAQSLKDAFAAETAQALSSAIINAYTQALVDQAGADINANAVNAVNTAVFRGGGAN